IVIAAGMSLTSHRWVIQFSLRVFARAPRIGVIGKARDHSTHIACRDMEVSEILACSLHRRRFPILDCKLIRHFGRVAADREPDFLRSRPSPFERIVEHLYRRCALTLLSTSIHYVINELLVLVHRLLYVVSGDSRAGEKNHHGVCMKKLLVASALGLGLATPACFADVIYTFGTSGGLSSQQATATFDFSNANTLTLTLTNTGTIVDIASILDDFHFNLTGT